METQQTLIRETTLKDYGMILVRRRWIILSFWVICMTVVTLGTFLMTPLYQASTKLIVEGENTNVRSPESPSAASVEVFENYLDTQIALIKSGAIAGKVYDEMLLEKTDRYRSRTGLGKILQKDFGEDISIEQVKGSKMIEIGVMNPDPELAAKIANRLADVYTRDNLLRRALMFIRNQRTASLNDEFLRLQSKLDSLSNRYGPKHPEMIALRSEIRTMAERIEKDRVAATRVPDPNNLAPDDQGLLEEALLKIQENSVFSSSRMNNIGVIETAYVPKSPVKPKKSLNIILGAVAGLIGGVLLAFFVDYLDDTIKTEEDLKRYLGQVTFMGSIFTEKQSPPAGQFPERMVEWRGDSPQVEAYRLVRMNILWNQSNEKSLKDFAIVSPGPAEGKTTIASNLAITMSQANLNVLFVDTDFRRGRLHDFYNIAGTAGLGEYLTDGLGFDKVVHKTEVPRLSVVAAGKSAIDSAQLLSSARMAEFIREARHRYDMIVYDTPPITIISDAAILVAQLGGALLSIRCGFTNQRVLTRALSMIQESKVRLLGVVLNDVPMNDGAGYNKYYSRYYKKTS